MPYAVALVGVASFLAGLAVANSLWELAGLFVGLAVGVAAWLRTSHFKRLDQAYQRGIEYAETTNERLRELPEVTEIPTPFEQMVARMRAKLNGEQENTDGIPEDKSP